MSKILTGIKNTDLLVIVEGRGTAEYCSELYQSIATLLKASPEINRILFDMSKAEYVDSSFIGLILSAKKSLPNEESPVSLLNPTNSITEIFKVMGLETFIPVLFKSDFEYDFEINQINEKLENSISDIKLLLESHQEIMATSPENYKRFALVEKVFQQELQKKSQDK